MAVAMIVEDGTGRPDANSGCSVADADLYHEIRGTPAAEWADLDTVVKELALIRATREVDQLGRQDGKYWIGFIVTAGQALAFPRSGLVDFDGAAISSTSVPAFYRDKIAEQAWAMTKRDRIAAMDDREAASLTIGGLSVDYGTAGGSSGSVLTRYVRSGLTPYLAQGPLRA